MLTFLIVTVVMLLVFLKDFRPLLKGGERRVTVFYSVATGAAFIIIALYCLNGTFATLFGA